MTATANRMAIKEISYQLKLKTFILLKSSINRSNLIINMKESYDFKVDLLDLLENKHQNKKTIIFCKTKDLVEDITRFLNDFEFQNVFFYYSKMNKENENRWPEFIKTLTGIMVCTCGFGTGVDVEHVSLIFHLGVPSSISDYYQEIGRGGRNGNICNCYLFFTFNNINNLDYNIGMYSDKVTKQ